MLNKANYTTRENLPEPTTNQIPTSHVEQNKTGRESPDLYGATPPRARTPEPNAEELGVANGLQHSTVVATLEDANRENGSRLYSPRRQDGEGDFAKPMVAQPIHTSGSSSSELLSSSSDDTSTSRVSEPQIDVVPTKPCLRHEFSVKHGELGRGTYGIVSKVSCKLCKMVVAQKEIFLSMEGSRRDREKHGRAMKDELIFLTTLKHPHIIEYVHHEHEQDNILQIFTEYCELGDLQNQFDRRSLKFSVGVMWSILRHVASALAKCHHGLNARILPDGSEEYYSFETSWEPIVHRDIKPANILLKRAQKLSNTPNSGSGDPDRDEEGECEDLFVKLGDFGTACRLEDGGRRSTWAGTREYWAPEIVKEAEQRLGRITAWSVKSDIWSVGTMIYHFLTEKWPLESFGDQDKLTLPSRIQALKALLDLDAHGSSEGPEALIKITCECLDPCPEKRPTALDLLCLALKADISEEGNRRSESFWKALASQPPDQDGVAAATTRHFVTEYLSFVDDTTFSAAEACLILSLQSRYSDYDILTSASRLSRHFSGKLEGASIFHGIAVATSQEPMLEKLVWDETKWPTMSKLSQMSLRSDRDGLLPSHIAALMSNVKVAKHLSLVEERARAEQLARAQDCAKEQISEDMKTNTRKEVDFLFTLLTECFSLSYTKSAAVRALVAAASYGYSSTVQNLVKMGIDPSASSGHRKETALHFAASAGDEALLVFLLDHQANIESRDNHRHTPLHCAAWAGHEGSVRILLARGADPNAQDDKGRTALFGAAGGGYLAVVKVLLANRAEYGIRGGVKNQTALERAESKGFADIAKVLRSQSTSSQGPSDQ